MSAEHVFRERADRIARSLHAFFRRETTYQRDRRALGGLTHHQHGGGGDRIGTVDHRDLQLSTIDVVLSAPVVQHADTGATDRAADRTEPPRPVHAVADDDAELPAGAFRD